jgi:pentatricopeptide repeat protein
VDVYGKAGWHEEASKASKVLKDMEDVGCPPNVVSHK